MLEWKHPTNLQWFILAVVLSDISEKELVYKRVGGEMEKNSKLSKQWLPYT